MTNQQEQVLWQQRPSELSSLKPPGLQKHSTSIPNTCFWHRAAQPEPQAAGSRQLPSTYMLLTGSWLKSCGTNRADTSVWRLGLFNPQANFANVCNTEEGGNPVITNSALTLLWLCLMACAASPLRAAFGIAARKDVRAGCTVAGSQGAPTLALGTHWLGALKALLLPGF